jgi:hypothetical protein
MAPTEQPQVLAQPAGPGLRADVKRVFLAWEKLRPVYNLVLALWALALLYPELERDPSRYALLAIALRLFWGAVKANLGYFAGPAAESYLRWLGVRTLWARAALFVTGTAFAMLIGFFALRWTWWD